VSAATREGRGAIRDVWIKGGWKAAGLWPEGASSIDELRRRFGAFHSAQYRRIVELARETGS
jgi:hypothetical protein